MNKHEVNKSETKIDPPLVTTDTKSDGSSLRVGSRKSQLALIQTNTVIDRLKLFFDNNPESSISGLTEHGDAKSYRFEIISMNTEGDRILDKPLPAIGSKSLFTGDLEVALLNGNIDFIVHSLKDLPTKLPDGCAIGAILKRDDPNDCIVLKKSLTSLKPLDLLLGNCKGGDKFKIGTSSLRRIALLKRCNINSECKDIRGNLNTRLAKLDDENGEFAAIVLAKAGLDRMSWSERSSCLLSPEVDGELTDWCYAVGQGAIAVECRSDDKRILDLLAPINDLKTIYECVAERSLLRKLEGGCSVPLGVRTTWSDSNDGDETENVNLRCVILSTDGKTIREASSFAKLKLGTKNKASRIECLHESTTTGIKLSDTTLSKSHVRYNINECSKLGISVANKLIACGCLELMKQKN